MSTQPLTAVRVQALLREIDAELQGAKPTVETLCRLLKRLDAANIPSFHSVSCTSQITGKRLLVSQLVYDLELRLEKAQKAEFENSRSTARTHADAQ